MFTKIGDNFGENALENEFPILPPNCGNINVTSIFHGLILNISN